MKKKILAIALAVVLVAVAGYSTLAYFTATDDATNTITADTLTIAINEYQTTDAGTTRVSDGPDGNGIIEIDAVPGDVISKIVKIENLPENTPAWIRVKVTVECKSSTGAVLPLTPITIDYTADWALKAGDATNIWYFDNSVSAGDETDPLFTNVTFDLATMDNTYQGATLTIVLEAQAVQAFHNGTSALDAAGWPVF